MIGINVPLADTQPDSTTRIDIRKLHIGCWTSLIVIAFVRAWFTRYEFDGDSISYLDIARAINEGHLRALIHAYWSPGYPVILSFFLWLFRPNAYWQCPLVHFVNVLIFIGALASFQLFWSEVWLWHKSSAEDSGAPIPAYAFWALGYSTFAIGILSFITVALVHPDLLVAAFCLLAAWSVLRFRRSPDIGRALILGIVLALGYYAKAPLFPMGFVFILCAFLGWPVSRRMILLGGTALGVFLLVSSPFIAALSRAKGRLTFGDSARLNYAFFIDGVQHYQHWQGVPPGSGAPIHPTRKLNDFPEIYEFADKNMGTYPPWFDPTYWYEGVIPHPNWKFQIKMLVANLILEFQILMDNGAELVCGAMILALLTAYRRLWTRGFWKLWPMWMPATVALPMFALVHVEPRFLGGWLILFFAAALCACSLPSDGGTLRAVSCVGIAVLITAGAAQVSQASQEALESVHAAGRNPRNAVIAAYLLNHGLHPDSKVAVIGDGGFAYWAHLARLHIVAEIPAHIWQHQAHPAFDFWALGPEEQRHSLEILAETRAEAVIADPQGIPAGWQSSTVPAPWKRIDGTTDAYVYFFHANR
jgi:hypothetical protein